MEQARTTPSRGVSASMTTAALAVGPFAAAVWAATVGYEAMLRTLFALAVAAALLAYRAGKR
jgi:hypothetical protein